jgi:hypothetical protein
LKLIEIYQSWIFAPEKKLLPQKKQAVRILKENTEKSRPYGNFIIFSSAGQRLKDA